MQHECVLCVHGGTVRRVHGHQRQKCESDVVAVHVLRVWVGGTLGGGRMCMLCVMGARRVLLAAALNRQRPLWPTAIAHTGSMACLQGLLRFQLGQPLGFQLVPPGFTKVSARAASGVSVSASRVPHTGARHTTSR